MRISDWSSDVCSSDLQVRAPGRPDLPHCPEGQQERHRHRRRPAMKEQAVFRRQGRRKLSRFPSTASLQIPEHCFGACLEAGVVGDLAPVRSEEHTSELQSLMRISYAVFCLIKQIKQKPLNTNYI